MKVYNIQNNQIVVVSNTGVRDFFSYNSHIARISKAGSLTLGSDWDYSRTTSKWLYEFLRINHFYEYQCKKDILAGIKAKEIKLSKTM